MVRSTRLLGVLLLIASAVSCGPSRRTETPPAATRPPAPPTAAGAVPGPSSVTPAPSGEALSPSVEGENPISAVRLNANSATREELLQIPTITDRVVGAMVENQPFVSISQFRREIGNLAPPDRVAAYERYLFVPVDPNRADTETLRQLPGVDLPKALELAQARPFASVDAFLAKLAELISSDEMEAGRPLISPS